MTLAEQISDRSDICRHFSKVYPRGEQIPPFLHNHSEVFLEKGAV